MANKSKQDGNVAFKVTYNDSNWSGVCSPTLAIHNFQNRVWCGEQSEFEINCQHPIYKIKENLNKVSYPCSDCIALKEFMFYPGHFHSKNNENEPISSLHVKEGKIAVFTSKEPFTDESERFIFAIGQISQIELVQDVNGPFSRFHCDKESAIIFKGKRPKFWAYYTNEKAPTRAAWNSLLFRYLEDNLIVEILNDIALTNRYPGKYRTKAEYLIQKINSPSSIIKDQ